jgi:hypothetical protein
LIFDKIITLWNLKRVAAILLTGVLFFNWYGYQLLSAYWQQEADQKLVARLDRSDFDESQLISLKIPLTTLSYYNSSTGFERVDGKIELNGIYYNYVKRRIFKDSLELLCIPNTTAMNLQKVKNDFFRQVNDLQQQTQGKKNASQAKDLTKDYTPSHMDIAVPAIQPASQPAPGIAASSQLPTCFTSTAERPPDQAACLS